MAHGKGVIFDVDGVLVDSYWAHYRSWQQLAAELNRSYSEEEFAAGFGRTSGEILKEQWGLDHLGQQEIEELVNRKEALYRQLIAEDCPLMPGAGQLIEALDRSGFAVGVGSSGPPANVELVVQALSIEGKLAAQISGRDVSRGKPDPQVFQLAAERMNLAPNRCIVVEDAAAGIEAAQRAGMPCIGLASTGRSREELSRAEMVVDSLTELTPELFENLLSRVES